jgi:hypothetical protein
MPIFTPWQNSPEYGEAKKIVADAAGRIKTVKADIARIVPKLNTYKKATLEKLMKEAEASYAAAVAKNQQLGGSNQPEAKYMNAVEVQAKRMKADLKRQFDNQMSQIEAEEKLCYQAANTFRAYGDGAGGGAQGIYARLCEQYDALRKAYKKELAAAAAEKEANPNRKV